MSNIKPFKVDVSQQQLDDLRQRLSLVRFPEKETVDDWSQGVPQEYIKELVSYWQNVYDLRRVENRLNALPQYTIAIDGLDIHYIHVTSPVAGARPLLLTHGWPGSVIEFLKVVEPLSDPVNHGGDASQAFHLVIPSLPGYGFSEKPTSTGWGLERIGRAWINLMDKLGYSDYYAQGGDWGSGVTSAIAQQDPEHCRGIHLNMLGSFPANPDMQDLSEVEQKALADMQHYRQHEFGYFKEQSTRPQTIGYSLVDSPVGLLAWIIEKFWAWTDCDGHPENALGRDEMLDNIMIYWLNGTGASSARLYWESGAGGFSIDNVQVPMGASLFPKEIVSTSRRWAENDYNQIVYWNEVERGGHFAAFEQPELFVRELRACFGLMDKL